MIVLPLLLQLSAAGPLAAPTRELRDAQARFESLRRMHLPVLHFPPRRCDVRIGRFCYWYDSAPPPKVVESDRIRAARDQLLADLDSAARHLPRDPWIAGQRVRYLLDAGRAGDAARLACDAPAWWCSALRGLALHVGEHHALADSAFSAALDAMPPPQRCEWTDISLVLDDPLAREIGRAPCGEREGLANAMWRLAQPLWMTPGNDVRSEHLARRTMDVILDGSANPHGSRWGNDMRELLLRYGWSETFTRSPPEALAAYSWSVVGHGRKPSWNVMPGTPALRSPWVARDAWNLSDPLARTRYAPRHLSALLDLEHQLVRIPRGDSMLVAVALQPSDSALLGDTVDAALMFAVPGPPRGAALPGFTGSAVVPAETTVVSVELLGRASRRAARARYSIAPPACSGAWCLSDVLLFAPEPGRDSLQLGEALERSLPPRIPRDQPVGAWWHVRGAAAPAGTPLALRLTLEPARGSAARRAVEALRLARSRSAVRLRWQTVQHSDTSSAQVVLRLPERAGGRYRLTLSVQPRGGQAVTSTRELKIAP